MIRERYSETLLIQRSYSRTELIEMTTWLIGQTGNPSFWEDCHVEEDEGWTAFYFKDAKLALHFKLRWHS